jgi:glycine betaine/proline transport system permease protein
VVLTTCLKSHIIKEYQLQIFGIKVLIGFLILSSFILKLFNTWLIVDVLQPMRALFLRMPAVATLVLAVGAGYLIGGIRSALVIAALTLFIALSPWWDRALVTLYMATFGVVVSCLIGFTVGTLSFQIKISCVYARGL